MNFRNKTLDGDDFYDLWAYTTQLRRMSLRELRRSSNYYKDAPNHVTIDHPKTKIVMEQEE